MTLTPEEVAAVAEKLSECERQALLGAFKTTAGLAPSFGNRAVFSLDRSGLSAPFGVWSLLTPLGLAVHDYLRGEQK